MVMSTVSIYLVFVWWGDGCVGGGSNKNMPEQVRVIGIAKGGHPIQWNSVFEEDPGVSVCNARNKY